MSEQETTLVRLPVKLFAAYGALEGLARTITAHTSDRHLVQQIDAQLKEIERLWNGGEAES